MIPGWITDLRFTVGSLISVPEHLCTYRVKYSPNGEYANRCAHRCSGTLIKLPTVFRESVIPAGITTLDS